MALPVSYAAGMGQYRASSGPMLAASAQYWPGTGPLCLLLVILAFLSVYRDMSDG